MIPTIAPFLLPRILGKLRETWPEAECYCVLNAVLPRYTAAVAARLAAIARERRILVASISTSNETFSGAPWLRDAEGHEGAPLPARGLQLYVSC